MTDNFYPDLQWLSSINNNNFEEKALALFRHQYNNVTIYKEYCDCLKVKVNSIDQLTDIPFLPISFFRSHRVLDTNKSEALLFESSGTTGMIPSRHFIARPELYKEAFRRGFRQFYGKPEDYIILGLLPSYLERQHSSLVYMVQDLIDSSAHPASGFYLNEWDRLSKILTSHQDRKIFLIGVTFGLLDLAEAVPMDLSRHIVMETGGMKGRRTEWTRMEVHDLLRQQWRSENIHSEYGMSEMLSQAYSKGNGVFESSDTMRVFLRDENDPLETFIAGTGCVNIVDLANIDSCAFIATEDIGKVHSNGTFEILGRRDAAALRGCSLMVV